MSKYSSKYLDQGGFDMLCGFVDTTGSYNNPAIYVRCNSIDINKPFEVRRGANESLGRFALYADAVSFAESVSEIYEQKLADEKEPACKNLSHQTNYDKYFGSPEKVALLKEFYMNINYYTDDYETYVKWGDEGCIYDGFFSYFQDWLNLGAK